MKKYLRLLGFLFALGTSYVNAQTLSKNFYQNHLDLGGSVTILDATERVVNNENYVDFEIESNTDGDFVANFWLMPTRHSDNTYSIYKVYVDNKFVGTINPTSGNWQSIGLTGNKKISINEGRHTISIAVKSPEHPSIEFVKLGETNNNATINSEYYDTFYAKAESNSKINESFSKKAASLFMSQYKNPIDTIDQMISTYSSSTGYITRTAYVDYTFYKKYDMVAGVSYTFNTEAWVPHFLEIYSNVQGAYASTKMSSLNINDQSWSISHTITVPYTGEYYFRVRAGKQTTVGICNLSINNADYYDNIPIFSYGYICSQGGSGDNNYYASFTKGATPVDPIMYIQSSNGNILAWNDDNNSIYARKYNLDKYDPYIRTRYNTIPAYAVYLTSSASTCPAGSCTLFIRVKDTDDVGIISTRSNLSKSEDNETTKNKIILPPNELSIYPNPINLNSTLNIECEDGISQLSVYDMAGRLIVTKMLDDSFNSISLSDLNINNSGMYIIKTNSNSGVKTQKLIVR